MTQPYPESRRLAGAGGLRHQAPGRHRPYRRRGSRRADQPGPGQDPNAVAQKYGIDQAATDLAEALARPEIDAVILCTPTQMHAAQAMACLRAGKHVQVEIPMADTLKDAEALAALARRNRQDRHVRPYAALQPQPPVRASAVSENGEFHIQQMDVQTYFFRRTNMNALGEPRSWTDHLLWHHAAHTVDLFAYQCGSPIVRAHAVQGPIHPDTRHRHGHVDPAEGGQRRHLHVVAELQQRWPAGHLLPLHRRHRHLHRPLRRSDHRPRRNHRRQPRGRIDERH